MLGVYYADTRSIASARGERTMVAFANGKIEAFVWPPGVGTAHDVVAGIKVQAKQCGELTRYMKHETERIISPSDRFDPSRQP